MDAEFWHTLWQEGRLGFHQPRPNGRLVQHLPGLDLAPGARIFVPLCGKTLDIGWLRDGGFHVTGAELSEDAVQALFSELGVTPEIEDVRALRRYSAPGVEIYVGDIFDLDAATLGPVDAIYDRAALVALPSDLRTRYAAHLRELTGTAPQLLLSFEYDQRQMDGPPFSVTGEDIARLYADHYTITSLSRDELPDGLKTAKPAWDTAWLLRQNGQP